ncbi:MAG: hypothetical protein U1E91_06005 [Moraxella sp.]
MHLAFLYPKFITDEDNPLIDRKYPNEMTADDGVALASKFIGLTLPRCQILAKQ